MSNTHVSIAERSPASRSMVANRPLMTRGVDGRTASARRFRDIAQSLIDDLGGAVSESQMLLVKQAAMVTLRVEKLQAEIVSGGDADPELIIRLSNTQTRSLQELGLGLKRGRGAAPSGSNDLASYLSQIADDDAETEVEPVEVETVIIKSHPPESAPATEDVAEAVDGAAP
jgi:hypothetical protein